MSERERSTSRLVVDIDAAARAGLAVKVDLADLQILYFIGRAALDIAKGGDAADGFVDAGFERVREFFAHLGMHLGIDNEEEYAARINTLTSIKALEIRTDEKAAPQFDAVAAPQHDTVATVAAPLSASIMVRLSELVSGAQLFPTLVAAAPQHDAVAAPQHDAVAAPPGGRRGIVGATYSTAVQALMRESDSMRRLGFIASYLDSEYDMGEAVSLLEFLDLCMGIVRGECDTIGIHVGGVYGSVYDPKSLKSIRALTAVVYNAVSVVAPVLDAIGALGMRPQASVAGPQLDAVAGPHPRQLDIEQFRELITDYVKEFSKSFMARGGGATPASGMDHAEIEDLATPEAVAAFRESVEAYSPGEPPHFYVETVLGCGLR